MCYYYIRINHQLSKACHILSLFDVFGLWLAMFSLPDVPTNDHLDLKASSVACATLQWWKHRDGMRIGHRGRGSTLEFQYGSRGRKSTPNPVRSV